MTKEELTRISEEEMRELHEKYVIWGVHLSEEKAKKYKYGNYGKKTRQER